MNEFSQASTDSIIKNTTLKKREKQEKIKELFTKSKIADEIIKAILGYKFNISNIKRILLF